LEKGVSGWVHSLVELLVGDLGCRHRLSNLLPVEFFGEVSLVMFVHQENNLGVEVELIKIPGLMFLIFSFAMEAIIAHVAILG